MRSAIKRFHLLFLLPLITIQAFANEKQYAFRLGNETDKQGYFALMKEQGKKIDEANLPLEFFEIKVSPPNGGEDSYIESKVDSTGVLTYRIRTASKNGDGRGPIPGSELFRRMMEFHGPSIKEVLLVWSYGNNLADFYIRVSAKLQILV